MSNKGGRSFEVCNNQLQQNQHKLSSAVKRMIIMQHFLTTQLTLQRFMRDKDYFGYKVITVHNINIVHLKIKYTKCKL